MRSSRSFLRAGAIVMVAGLAYSSASAQMSDGLFVKPNKSGSVSGNTRGMLDGGTVNPIKVEVDGVEVPFTIVNGTGAADSQVVLYENLAPTLNSISATHRYRVLDDFGFAGGQSARVTGFRPAFGTPPAGTAFPLVNVTVEAQFFAGFNPAVTPVNSPPSGNVVRVTYAFPAGIGWAANTIYTGAAFILYSGGSVGPILTNGGVEVKVLNGTTLAAHADIAPAFCGAGVTIGTSNDNAFFDLNSDGIYQGANAGAGNEATGPGVGAGLPGLANLRFAIQGQVVDTAVGACCLPDGACVILSQSQCLGLSGVYHNDGSTCASVVGHCATGPVLHNNGSLITGPTALNGTPAPAGTNWAEGVQEGSCPTNINGPNISGVSRVADDFTVPAGKQWAVNKLTIWAYASPGTTATSPVTAITLRIWNGPPNNPASTVVYGDTTTNLYSAANASFDNLYRIFNSALLAQVPGTTRPVWRFNVPISTTLQAGTYWADWNVTGGPFAPQVTLMTNATNGVRDLPAGNALQLITAPAPNVGTGWQFIGGNGAVAGCTAEVSEMPFILEGTETSVGGCYANCDQSTSPPILNANDFQCFLNEFAAQTSYANCDLSTSPPVLNANDFQCFLNAFAGGCS